MTDPLVPVGEGHTALTDDDRAGLRLSYIVDRRELNDAEQRNIVTPARARPTAGPGRRTARPSSVTFVLSDLRTAIRKDPALHGIHVVEVLLYAGLWALWTHRVAHRLWRAGVPFVPRLLSEVARRLTGVEIHPGATVGRGLFIDHGTGVVIGETAVVGDDCVLYHGVTLGGRGWWVDAKGSERHPTVGHGVTLGVGCSVLGAVTVGDGARIGPHAVVLDDVPAGCVVVAPKSRCVRLRGQDEPVAGDDGTDVPEWLTTTYEMGGL